MKISINSNDALANTTYTTTYTNTYDAFMDSLSFEKNNAINAVYDMGYITEDEALQLKEEGFARRNEHTSIQLVDSFDKITLYCNEFDDGDGDNDNDGDTVGVNLIFKLSYIKLNGYVVDELNDEMKLNMN